MSGASRSNNSAPLRALRQEERELIQFLLARFHHSESFVVPVAAQVKDMSDEGMGGIRFARTEVRRFGKELARAEYKDADGVPVSITINADDRGDLFEVDFWKVDFSPLKRYPRPQDLTFQ